MRHTIVTAEGRSPYENLAFEQLLVDACAADEGILYLWQTHNTVVIGASQNAWAECRCDVLRAEGGTLARRKTGGGAVYQDSGNLNFTFIFPTAQYDLPRQLALIVQLCHAFGIDAQASGRNDITVQGRKFSGNAFSHKKHCSLQHGTLLIDTDFDKLTRYLAPPAQKLEAKGVKSVRARVANLREFCPKISVQAVKETLIGLFVAQYEHCTFQTMQDYDRAQIAARTQEFSAWEWNYGKTPNFTVQHKERFGWGGAEVLLNLQNGVIAQVACYTDSLDTALANAVQAALLGVSYGEQMKESLLQAAQIQPERGAALRDIAGILC